MDKATYRELRSHARLVDYLHNRYIWRVNALIAQYPPQSDVAAHCQSVPCVECGRRVLVPGNFSEQNWRVPHFTPEHHRVDEGSPSDRIAGTFHYGIAEAHEWLDATGAIVRIWLPATPR